MTTTSTFSGLGDDAKPTSRVLKPPGGGSSNIFGSEPASAPSGQARTPGAKKPADSNIFGKGHGSSDSHSKNRTARDGEDSFNRVFGDYGSTPTYKHKGHCASQPVDTHSNLFGDNQLNFKSRSKQADTHSNLFGNYEGASTPSPTTPPSELGSGTGAYNPITGADYNDLVPTHHALNQPEPPKPQKVQPPAPGGDGEFQAKEGKATNVHTTSRITNPPGGKTHKLW